MQNFSYFKIMPRYTSTPSTFRTHIKARFRVQIRYRHARFARPSRLSLRDCLSLEKKRIPGTSTETSKGVHRLLVSHSCLTGFSAIRRARFGDMPPKDNT